MFVASFSYHKLNSSLLHCYLCCPMEQRSATVRTAESEIDFNDVFGGPPTWTRYSYSGTRMKSWEETTVSETGSFQRPVFGESYGRRSDESVRSTRSLSAKNKMTKAVDIPVFGSHVNTQHNHLSRFSSPATQILINNPGQSTGQTSLTRESSSVQESPDSKRSTKDVDHKSKARTGSSSTEFHFSMHKWANVGVPSLMALHEGKHPGSSRVSGLSIDSMQDMNLVSRTSLREAIEKESLAMKEEVKSSLLHDDIERKGYEEAGSKANMETVSGKKKLEAKKMNSSSKAEAKNRVKGMVQDFFKKSNSRKSSKNQNQDIEMMTDASKTTNLACNNVTMMPVSSFTVKEENERSNMEKFAQNRTIRRLEDINFKEDAAPASDSVPNSSQASVETTDEPSLDHYWVEELAPVESEAIMALDSKIHMWSSGRTGNIRSLLSTLQLILWAESGWKPVALVDIIEANALKKFYNRAMLCLHPDKLQQKGVDSHKRYIAKKVLDILQEAWDHWNSLDGAVL